MCTIHFQLPEKLKLLKNELAQAEYKYQRKNNAHIFQPAVSRLEPGALPDVKEAVRDEH